MNDTTRLPRSLRVKAARMTAARESAVLDNFAVCREIEVGAFAGPGKVREATDYVISAEALGLTWDEIAPGVIAFHEDSKGEVTTVAVLIPTEVEPTLCPTEAVP